MLALSWTTKNTKFLSELFTNWNSFFEEIYQNKTIWNCWNFSFPLTLLLKKCSLKYVRLSFSLFFPSLILISISRLFWPHFHWNSSIIQEEKQLSANTPFLLDNQPNNWKPEEEKTATNKPQREADKRDLLLYISLYYDMVSHHTWLQVIVIAKTGHHVYSLMIASPLTLSKHAKVESGLQMTAANNTSVDVDLIVTLQQNWIISSITKPGVQKDLKGNLSIQHSEWMWVFFLSLELL